MTTRLTTASLGEPRTAVRDDLTWSRLAPGPNHERRSRGDGFGASTIVRRDALIMRVSSSPNRARLSSERGPFRHREISNLVDGRPEMFRRGLIRQPLTACEWLLLPREQTHCESRRSLDDPSPQYAGTPSCSRCNGNDYMVNSSIDFVHIARVDTRTRAH